MGFAEITADRFTGAESQTPMRTNNTSDAWPLVGFTASTIIYIYRCIPTFAFPLLSIAMQGITVFTEILPIRELEPTREPAVEVREWAQFVYGMEHI